VNEEPEFLTFDEILEIHDDQIQNYGGDVGVRDRGLLESAVAMPQKSFGGQYLQKTSFEMAAAYAFHLAESQAFVDGNKRTGLAAAYMFGSAMCASSPVSRDHLEPRSLLREAEGGANNGLQDRVGFGAVGGGAREPQRTHEEPQEGGRFRAVHLLASP